MRGGCDGSGQRSSGASASSPPPVARIDLDAAAHRVAAGPAIDVPLEAVARLGAHAERAAGAADPGRIPVGRLQQHVAGLEADLGRGAAHDAREADDALRVRDRDHLAVELPLLVVEGHEPLARPAAPDDQRRAAQGGRVVGVHRLVQLEHHVVGGVHHVVDRAHPDRLEPPRAATPGEAPTCAPRISAAWNRGQAFGSSIVIATAPTLPAAAGAAGGRHVDRLGARESRAAGTAPGTTRPARAPRPCGRAGRDDSG